MTLRVAVIGAGAAGLVALRHLVANSQKFSAVAFEQTKHVGGTWVYTDQIGTDEFGLPVHASMYKNMKTNLPKEVMAFPDFPFPDNLSSFMRHDEVRQYLNDYADHFQIRQYIKFETVVEKVHPTKVSSPGTKWEVTFRGVIPDHQEPAKTEIFDCVMVCNGHYAVPLLPDIPGLDQFKGEILHSHDYRDPNPYKDKRVVVLGAAASGQDISLDIAPVAKEVILSHRKDPLASELPQNVHQTQGIKEVHSKTVVFENNEEVEADVILFCTGYRYRFPFLSPECHVDTQGERVTPMYKHLVHTEYPSLFFLGLCKVICPFPQFHCQVKFALAALDGSMKLPTTEEMNQAVKEDYEWRLAQGMPHRFAHHMRDLQWDYNDDLAKTANFEPIPTVVKNLYDAVHIQRSTNLTTYKMMNYEVTGKDSFREVSVGRT